MGWTGWARSLHHHQSLARGQKRAQTSQIQVRASAANFMIISEEAYHVKVLWHRNCRKTGLMAWFVFLGCHKFSDSIVVKQCFLVHVVKLWSLLQMHVTRKCYLKSILSIDWLQCFSPLIYENHFNWALWKTKELEYLFEKFRKMTSFSGLGSTLGRQSCMYSRLIWVQLNTTCLCLHSSGYTLTFLSCWCNFKRDSF